MRAVWFAAGILIILSLGTWLLLPGESAHPTNTNQGRSRLFNDTDLTQPAISVEQAVAHPELYQNYQVCLTGYYQKSFEFSALAEHADLPTLTLTPPLVWIDLTVPTRTLECRLGAGNEQSCFGQLTLCGIFSYNTAGGFGHLGQYQYQLGIQRSSVQNENANAPLPVNVQALGNLNDR